MHSFYVVWTVRGHEWFFLVNNRLALPVFIGCEEAVLRPLLTSVLHDKGYPKPPWLSVVELTYSQIRETDLPK